MPNTFTPYLWILKHYPNSKSSELINLHLNANLVHLEKEFNDFVSKLPEISNETLKRIIDASK